MSGPPLVVSGAATDAYGEWQQITSGTWEDPGGHAAAHSISGSGVSITMQLSTILDGYREQAPRYIRTLNDLIPGFDFDTHDLELALTSVVVPSTGLSLTGIWIGLLDSATLASGNGEVWGIRDQGAADSNRLYRIGQTVQSVFETITDLTGLILRISAQEDGLTIRGNVLAQVAGGSWYWPGVYPNANTTMGTNDPSVLQVVVAGWRSGAGDGLNSVVSGIPWIRRVQRGSWP